MKTLNLAQSFEMLKIREKLLTCRNTSFGDGIRAALANNDLDGAITMVKEQIALGNTESVEWCIGASTLGLIDKLES